MLLPSFASLLQVVVTPLPPGGGIPFEAVIMAKMFFTTLAVIALGVPVLRALSRRFIDRPPTNPQLASDVTARLARIEQAVDTISIEVERISEAQRYTTRLLSEGRSPEKR